MMLRFVPVGKPAGVSANQEKGNGSWRVGFPVKIDTFIQKLVKKDGSKSLNEVEGSMVFYRRADRIDEKKLSFEYTGAMNYRASMEADADIPGSRERYVLELLIEDDEAFDRIIRLSAFGHIPSVTVRFPDTDLGFGSDKKEEDETGLSYSDDNVDPDIVWDTEKFKSIGIESFDLNYTFDIAPASKPELEDEEAEAAAATMPATRAQMALLIATIRNVGIGLGALLAVLHYLH